MKYLIVGYGNIGHKRERVLGSKCIGRVDPDPKQKADYKLSSDIPNNLLDKFNAVVIATPRQPKLALVEYWLKKEKNILVEKPLILPPTKVKLFCTLAKENKIIWYTGYNHHFEENIQRLQEFIEQGKIGKFYHAKMEYSFGNIKEIIGTWRETGYGDLDEAGCHLIDFTRMLFGYKGKDFKSVSLRKIEGKVFDHCIFSTKDGKVICEVGWTTWKNVFKIDIYGSLGSLHLDGLRKWGTSKLIYRQRVFPAGAPKEKVFVEEGPDTTWQDDIQYFEKIIKTHKNSLVSDIENTQALVSIALSNNLKDKKTVYQKLQGLLDKYRYVV